MKFWDASAIVPLLVSETSSRHLMSIVAEDSEMFVWWGSEVECISALARLEREDSIDERTIALAVERLHLLTEAWNEVEPSDVIRETANRLLRVHPLRAADALQLAAAFLAAEQRPESLTIVTLDERLARAARKEGFAVLDVPTDH